MFNAEMSPASTTEPAESPVQSDGGELRVLMSLMKPEIILVEDAAELKTEALMMTVNHPDFIYDVCKALKVCFYQSLKISN